VALLDHEGISFESAHMGSFVLGQRVLGSPAKRDVDDRRVVLDLDVAFVLAPAFLVHLAPDVRKKLYSSLE
jgi:hypothetical protein